MRITLIADDADGNIASLVVEVPEDKWRALKPHQPAKFRVRHICDIYIEREDGTYFRQPYPQSEPMSKVLA